MSGGACDECFPSQRLSVSVVQRFIKPLMHRNTERSHGEKRSATIEINGAGTKSLLGAAKIHPPLLDGNSADFDAAKIASADSELFGKL
jgi:hypothetical protein